MNGNLNGGFKTGHVGYGNTIAEAAGQHGLVNSSSRVPSNGLAAEVEELAGTIAELQSGIAALHDRFAPVLWQRPPVPESGVSAAEPSTGSQATDRIAELRRNVRRMCGSVGDLHERAAV